MADNGTIDIGFGLDTSAASVELERLKTQLDGISANLLHSQRTIETRTTKMVQDLSSALQQINQGTAQYGRSVQQMESSFGRAMSQSARGGLAGQQASAAAQSVIADARNAADAVTARITNELVSQFSAKLRAMDDMVAARLRGEVYRNNRFMAQNSPEMLAARGRADNYRDNRFQNQNSSLMLAARERTEAFTTSRFLNRSSDTILQARQRNETLISERLLAQNTEAMLEARRLSAMYRDERLQTQNSTSHLAARDRADKYRDNRFLQQNSAEAIAAREILNEYRDDRARARATSEMAAARERSDKLRDAQFLDRNSPELIKARETSGLYSDLRLLDRTTPEAMAARQRADAFRDGRFQTLNSDVMLASRSRLNAYRDARTEAESTAEMLAAKLRADGYRDGRFLLQNSDERLKLRERVDGYRDSRIEAQNTAEMVASRVRADQYRDKRFQEQNTEASLAARQRQDAYRDNRLLAQSTVEALAARQRNDALTTERVIARTADAMMDARRRGGDFSDSRYLSRNSVDMLAARLQSAQLSDRNLLAQATEPMLAARQRANDFRNNRYQEANSAELLAARQALSRRRDQDNLFEAQNGRAALQHRNTMERFDANGGANIMAVQSRVLANFTALSLAFNSLRNTASFVVELDSEFKQFQAITAASSAEMVGLKDRLIEVSEQSKFTALEIAEAATIMGQAGLTARQVADSVGAVATLATAAGTSLAEAVDVVTSTMSVFNLQTSQTANVANTMTSALNLSKLSIDKIALGLQYSGNIASDVGMTYQELTASLGAMANAGIRSGSTLGTGLRQLLIDIQSPTAKFKSILQDLGLSEADINVESNGLLNVLNTLKKAGFGTAEALDAFETRAASAYSALANNTDLAADLQEQFTLSNAAIEANAVQMESLSNTWAKWQSVFGTVVYRAFEPFIGVLQKVINGFADFFSLLGGNTVVLQTVGALVAGLVTVGTISLLGALTRGVWASVPAFAGMTASVTSAAGAFGALRLAMLSHPVLLIIGGLTTAASLMGAFGDHTNNATTKVDNLRARLNSFKDDVSESNNSLDAINKTISQLITQREALDRDPIMRRAKIEEVKQQFTELYGEVDSTTSSVEELIGALNRLGDIKIAKVGGEIAAAVAAQAALQQGIEQKLTTDSLTGRVDLLGGARDFSLSRQSLSDTETDELMRLYQQGGQNPGPYLEKLGEYFVQAIIAEFGPKIGEAAAVASLQSELPDDPLAVRDLHARTSAQKTTLETELERLKFLAATQPLSAEDQARMGALPELITVLELLTNTLTPMVNGVVELQQSKRNLEGLEKEQRANEVLASPQYDALNKQAQYLQTTVRESLTQLQRDSIGMSAEDLLAAYTAIQDKFKSELENLEAEAEGLVAVFPDYDPEEVKGAAQEVFNTLANLQLQIKTKANSSNVALAKLNKEVFQNKNAVIDREIQQALRKAGKATSQAELDEIQQFLVDKYAEKHQLLKDIFETEEAIAGPNTDLSDLTSEHRRNLETMRLDEQDDQQAIVEARVKVELEATKQLKQATDEQIRVHKSKLRELIDKIKKAHSGEALDSLIAQYNEILGSMTGLQGQSATLGMQSAFMESTGAVNLNSSQAEKAQAAMAYFMSQNWSYAQAAGIVGNLLTESGLNTTARGDGGKAFGIAQWHPDRQARLDKYVRDFGGHREDYMTQVRFVDYEFKNYELKAYHDLLKQTSAAGAADSVRLYYERPTADPVLGHHDRRRQYANALVNGGFSQSAQSNAVLDGDLADAIDTSTTNRTRASTNNAVKTSNQLINQMMTQAKGLADPEVVKGLIDSVDAEFKNIIEARTKLFNQENNKGLAEGDPTLLAERENMLEGIRADQATKVAKLLEEYYSAADRKIQEPLKEAQAALAAAQTPGMEGKYTSSDIAQLQSNVNLAEREVQIQRAIVAEQMLLQVQQQRAAAEAQFGAGSAEEVYWMNEEIRAKQQLVELTREKNALEAASARGAITTAGAIQAANTQWALNNGLIRQNVNGMYEMIPLSEQVGNAWGQVLDGLTSGFSTLFTDLVSGTMTAEDAFKKFALSVIDMFIQMIAKALAMQMVMAMTGGGSGGGGGDFFSTLLGGLFGVPGMALGGAIRGAANGELIEGGVENRDSVLRRVMPGEFILRKSAVSAIGEDTLQGLNNLGNRSLAQSGITPMSNNDKADNAGGIVNVWVVSPDQQPSQMGPNDIVAVISDNIQRRGSIKQLIKQVQTGAL